MATSGTGIILNEDNSHYCISRAGQALDESTVASWVDQYAGTQVTDLVLNVNAMRTTFGSQVWDPIWAGYDPEGGPDQPMFQGLRENLRSHATPFVHTAWDLHRRGIDPYRLWIDRARQKGIRPWISMRMNDVHFANQPHNHCHSTFWRRHPEFYRAGYRAWTWPDRALDYGRPEVRAYSFSLIEEIAGRYDLDGLELDWMRHGLHFRPGRERDGAALLTGFVADVRRLLDEWEQKRGHRIELSARVPSRPQTSLTAGMDGAEWARRGLVQCLVPTPFYYSAEPDMPIELWRQLLEGSGTRLCPGLELQLYPDQAYAIANTGTCANSVETVRGAAAALLHRGADGIYLFNYMDCDTAMKDPTEYAAVLREAGRLQTLADKPRRHVVTFSDFIAPGEPQGGVLPCPCGPGRRRWAEFRVPIGPRPAHGQAAVILGVAEGPEADESTLRVLINGKPCTFTGPACVSDPRPRFALYAYRAPLADLFDGDNMIDINPAVDLTLGWVEIRITPGRA